MLKGLVVYTKPLRHKRRDDQRRRNSNRALPRAISSPSLIGWSPAVFRNWPSPTADTNVALPEPRSLTNHWPDASHQISA